MGIFRGAGYTWPVITVDPLMIFRRSSQVGAGKRLDETCRDLDRYHPISHIYINIHLKNSLFKTFTWDQWDSGKFQDPPGLHL